MQGKPTILIFGAGVIGSVYAVELSKAGHDVSVYARSARLAALQTKGLLYNEHGIVKKANVSIIDRLDDSARYDYVFVTVRYEQAERALGELSRHPCPNVVTFINNPDGFALWEKLVGSGRLIPAFAGAGGGIENDVLHYCLTPALIQSTTFGEIDGCVTGRINRLATLFKTAKMSFSICSDMDSWMKSHLALVLPLAQGVYAGSGNCKTVAKNKEAIHEIALSLKRSFQALKHKGITITPSKLNIIRLCPMPILRLTLKTIFRTRMAINLIDKHTGSAKGEIDTLQKRFDELVVKAQA